MNRTCALALVAAVAACSDVPDSPTWTEDVRPIMVANCTRCHSPPYIGGAPAGFRLDIYHNIALLDGPDENELPDVRAVGAAGNSVVAPYVAQRVIDGEMPPRYELSDRQIDTIANWAEAGAPFGEPRPDNALPTIELTEALVEQSDRVAIHYSIADDDFDLVTGIVCATTDDSFDPVPPLVCAAADNPLGADSPTFVRDDLVSGIGRVTWNTRLADPGTYRLLAQLDDGQELTIVELGSVEVQP